MPENHFDSFVWSFTNKFVLLISRPLPFLIFMLIIGYYFFYPIETLTQLFYYSVIEFFLMIVNWLLAYRMVKTILHNKDDQYE